MVRNIPHLPPATPVEPATEAFLGAQSLPIRTLTHNIRYAATDLDENERPWRDRCPLIVAELQYHTRFLNGATTATKGWSEAGASFICLQECLHNQLRDILSALNSTESTAATHLPDGPDWAHIGVGRDDGKTAGEYSPILYARKLFKLLHFENTWLSPTPDKPSKGWDADNKRILTTGVFEHRFTKHRLAVFNTHLDNEGSESREKSVPVILGVISRVRGEWGVLNTHGASGLNFILAGDFNSRPNMEAYMAMTASGAVVDAFEAVPKAARYGDEVTFTGFTPRPKDGNGVRRIDFVWFGPRSRVGREGRTEQEQARTSWSIEGYSTLPNVFDEGVFSSDHRCVVADAVLWRH